MALTGRHAARCLRRARSAVRAPARRADAGARARARRASPRPCSGCSSSRSCSRRSWASPSAAGRPTRCRWRWSRGPRAAARLAALARRAEPAAGASCRARGARGPRPRARGAGGVGRRAARLRLRPDAAREPGRAAGGGRARCSAPPDARTPSRRATREITEPGARYIDFLVPGLLGMNLMGTGMWGVGFSLVVARNGKLLKRLVARPRAALAAARRAARLAAHLPGARGRRAARLRLLRCSACRCGARSSRCAAVSLLGALAFSGLGLLTAARPRTIEGVSGVMNLVMVPMWVFSGIFFSTERFPAAIQPFIQALPLTALNDALRAVMLEGAGLAARGPGAPEPHALGRDQLRDRAQGVPLAVSRVGRAPMAPASSAGF